VASAAQVQAFVDWHHKQCVKALQLIAQLADTGSEEHKERFNPNGEGDGIANGWRVAEAMREIANDTIGNVPVMERSSHRGFWCEFNTEGQCLDLVEGNRDEKPGIGYVWIQEGVEELEIYKRAMDSMAAQMIHPKMTGLEMAKMQLGGRVGTWNK
jgi:hypothetical protein